MKRLVIAAMAAVLFCTATAAFSLGRPLPEGEVTVEVVSDRGRAFLSIPHRDFWKDGTHVIKQYLEARQGENYGIVIRNRTAGRVGVVIAVDGRNIISGERSDLKHTEAMYIVDGRDTARYDGWRTSREEVHRFYFTDSADSYSVMTFGDSSALGVIAVAVFREQDAPRLLEQKQQRSAPAAPEAAGRAGALFEDRAATGFGDAQHSPVVTVEFLPERNPLQKTLVKYEWREVLCRKGLVRCGHDPANRLWDRDGYAPFPPGYPES